MDKREFLIRTVTNPTY